jgi:release factor glutamine methyltransferase
MEVTQYTGSPQPKVVNKTQTMILKDVLQKTTLFFRDKGFEPARLETELLLAHGLGWDRVKLYLNYDYLLTEEELTRCRELVRRRASGEPVAYILGYKDFYKHTFKVSPDVLIPRPETESIVEEAVTWSRKQSQVQASVRVVDLGAGSGCIGISILAELPIANLIAVDISEKALAITSENADGAGVGDRTRTLVLDAGVLTLDALENSAVDIIVANPPYISQDDPEIQESVKKFEPHLALFSGDRGFAHIKAWAISAARIARPGAFVMFEIGHDQGAQAKQIFEEPNSFFDVTIVRDLAGHERFVRCFARGEIANG